MLTTKKRMSTETLVLGAILTALVFLLQMAGSFIKFGPFSISLVLIPIVIGAATCGTAISTWLGLIFGIAVLVSGDALLFWQIDPIGTVITVLAKGILCGLLGGLSYNWLKKFNRYVAVIVAAIVCPVVNTGVFLLGCLIFFMDTITLWAQGGSVVLYMILVLVGANFLFELGTNIILSPVVVRLLNIRLQQK